MNAQISTLLYFYGAFLIVCGVVSVAFIGPRAKTALISGGTSGALAIATGYFTGLGMTSGRTGGILLAATLVVVFSWRSTKTFLKVLELSGAQPQDPRELRPKAIAFLIISLMAVVSAFVLALQLVWGLTE